MASTLARDFHRAHWIFLEWENILTERYVIVFFVAYLDAAGALFVTVELQEI